MKKGCWSGCSLGAMHRISHQQYIFSFSSPYAVLGSHKVKTLGIGQHQWKAKQAQLATMETQQRAPSKVNPSKLRD